MTTCESMAKVPNSSAFFSNGPSGSALTHTRMISVWVSVSSSGIFEKYIWNTPLSRITEGAQKFLRPASV